MFGLWRGNIYQVEQKLVGTLDHWVTRTPSASAKRSAEQKLRNKNWWGLLAIGWQGPQVQVQKGQWNKNGGTKMAEQKWQNKNYSLFRVTQTKIGGDSASAKRSAEQKLVSGTKTAEQQFLGRTKIGGQNKKRSVEQKLVSRTKTAEQKLVSRTKMAEQKLFIIPSHPNKNWWGQCKCKKVSGTKIGGHCQPLGDRDPKCKCKKVSGTKIVEQKLWNKNW